MDKVEVKVDLVGEELRFTAALRDNAPIVIDSVSPEGDGQGYLPLELFLISLCTCSGRTIVSLLRKKRKTVTSFAMRAEGFKREEHPSYFERIVLHCDLVSPDATDTDMARCIELTEEKYCPVWAMIKNTVKVECEFTIRA